MVRCGDILFLVNHYGFYKNADRHHKREDGNITVARFRIIEADHRA